MDEKARANQRVFELLYQLGEAYLERGQYDEAIEKFMKLVELGQENLQIYANLSKAYLHKEQFDDNAIHVFRKTLEYDPNNKVINNILSQLYLSVGKQNLHAYQIYKRALAEKPPHSKELMHYLIKIDYQNKNYDNAKTLATEYLNQFPDDVNVIPYYVFMGWQEDNYLKLSTTLKRLYNEQNNTIILKWLSLTYLKALKDASFTDDEYEINEDDIDYCKSYLTTVDQFNYLNDIYLFLAIKKIIKNSSPDKPLNDNQSIAEYELFLSDNSFSNIWDRGLNKAAILPRSFSFTQEIWNRIVPMNNIPQPMPTTTYNKIQYISDENFDVSNALLLIQFTNLDEQRRKQTYYDILGRFDGLIENALDRNAIPSLKRLNDGYLLFGSDIETAVDSSMDICQKYSEIYSRNDNQQLKFQIIIHTRDPNEDSSLLDELYILFEIQQLGSNIFKDFYETDADHKEQNNKIYITEAAHELIKDNSAYSSILVKNIDFPVMDDSMPIFEIAWEDPLEKLRTGVIKKIDRFQIVKEFYLNDALDSFKSIDTFLDRLVILKILRPDYPVEDRTKLAKIFLERAAIIGKLNHHNIAITYDINEDEGFCFIAREFVEGTQLTELIKANSSVELQQAMEICFQMGQGIAFAHNFGLIHARLKPNNVFISELNEVKLTDFSVPDFYTPLGEQINVNARAASYASPEQIDNNQFDHRTDIYSLALIFYELLTGTNPFYNDDQSVVYENIKKIDPPKLSVKLPHLPVRIDDVLTKALAKSPQDRFESIQQFLSELLEVLTT